MGTFAISKALSVRGGTTGNWFGYIGGGTPWSTLNSDRVAGINQTAFATTPYLAGSVVPRPAVTPLTNDAIITFDYDLSSNIISLDGGSPVSFNNLSPGFTVRSATLNIDSILGFNVADTLDLLYLRLGPNESPAFSIFSLSSTITFSYSTSPAPSILSVINNGFGIRARYNNNSISTVYLQNARITGTYDIVSASSPITSLPVTTVQAGDSVTINFSTGGGGKSIVRIHIQYTDNNNILHDTIIPSQDFISQTDTVIVFYFPPIKPTGQVSIIIDYPDVPPSVLPPPHPPGTTFFGSIPVGKLTVTFVDASGIYTLVQGKGEDTIYDRTANAATKKVNIPDPFIKTGFLP